VRRLTPLLLVLLVACGGTEGPRSEPAEAVAAVGSGAVALDATPTPDPGQLCSLEINTGDGWVARSGLGCPSDGTLVVASVGDVGRAGPTLDATLAGLLGACRAAGGCQALLLPGDLIYGPGADADGAWSGIWDDALSRLGVYGIAALGNHEYRHEPGPELKREVLFAADGRAGFVLPAANYAARILGPEGDLRLAIAAIDTDTIVRGESLAPLQATLATACSTGARMIVVGHHPASSQGRHTLHERPVEAALRKLLRGVPEGCRVVASFAGHDHDLQVWPAGCEEAGTPPVIVSGVSARGFRDGGDTHLTPCPASGATGAYYAGARDDGGYALMTLAPDGRATVSLYDTTTPNPLTTLELAP